MYIIDIIITWKYSDIFYKCVISFTINSSIKYWYHLEGLAKTKKWLKFVKARNTLATCISIITSLSSDDLPFSQVQMPEVTALIAVGPLLDKAIRVHCAYFTFISHYLNLLHIHKHPVQISFIVQNNYNIGLLQRSINNISLIHCTRELYQRVRCSTTTRPTRAYHYHEFKELA